MKQILCALSLTVAFTSIALGQVIESPRRHEMADSKKAEVSLYPAAEIQWKDGPASLAPGAKFAVLEGDPSKEGFFTMRLLLPDGFKIQPHWHPKVEHVTVISGTFNLGMGEKFDQTATRAMPAGTFGFWPADMKHFAWGRILKYKEAYLDFFFVVPFESLRSLIGATPVRNFQSKPL